MGGLNIPIIHARRVLSIAVRRIFCESSVKICETHNFAAPKPAVCLCSSPLPPDRIPTLFPYCIRLSGGNCCRGGKILLPQSKPDGFDSSLGEGASGATGNFALEPETVPLCQRPHPRGGCHGAAVTGGVQARTPSVIACGDATFPKGTAFGGGDKVSGTAQRRPLGGAGCERSEQTEGVFRSAALSQKEALQTQFPSTTPPVKIAFGALRRARQTRKYKYYFR